MCLCWRLDADAADVDDFSDRLRRLCARGEGVRAAALDERGDARDRCTADVAASKDAQPLPMLAPLATVFDGADDGVAK